MNEHPNARFQPHSLKPESRARAVKCDAGGMHAAGVTADGLLEDLAALVDAGLVVPHRDGHGVRFAVVEPAENESGVSSANQGR